MSRQIGLTAAIGIAAGFALVSLSPVQADSGLNSLDPMDQHLKACHQQSLKDGL